MEKAFVARKVARKLWSTEDAIDSAMSETAELLVMLLQARKDLNISATVGTEAAAKLNEALSAMTVARTAMAACHGELDEARLRLGIRTKMAGGDDGLPQKTIAAAPSVTELREIG